jgi:hypothetical protein
MHYCLLHNGGTRQGYDEVKVRDVFLLVRSDWPYPNTRSRVNLVVWGWILRHVSSNTNNRNSFTRHCFWLFNCVSYSSWHFSELRRGTNSKSCIRGRRQSSTGRSPNVQHSYFPSASRVVSCSAQSSDWVSVLKETRRPASASLTVGYYTRRKGLQ